MTDLQAGTTLLIHHIILGQLTEVTAIPVTVTPTTDKDTTETTTETGDTNQTKDTIRTKDMIREIKATKTGVITIKIDTGSTTEGDPTNTSTTETNRKHKSSLNTPIKICWKCCKR